MRVRTARMEGICGHALRNGASMGALRMGACMRMHLVYVLASPRGEMLGSSPLLVCVWTMIYTLSP